MDLVRLKDFFHTHCKIKLRNGKVVFGVIFPNEDYNSIYFASYQEHKKVFGNQLSVDIPGLEPLNNVLLLPEDIVGVEPILEEEEF